MEISLEMRNRKRIQIIWILVIALAVLFVIDCCLGQYALSVKEVFQTFIGKGSDNAKLVMYEFRLPRICLAILVGIAMGASGVIMQHLLHNDLASPGTLGVADGSSLFVTFYVALIAGNVDQPILLPILALAGGMISAVIIYLLGTKKNKPIAPIKLVMTGVAVSAAYSAAGTLAMYALDETQMEFLQRWQSGELWGTRWDYILILFVWTMVFLFLAMRQAHTLNVINLGYDIAAGLGVNVKKAFLSLSFTAVAISSAAAAFGGNFFFLGLIGPHIARKLIGSDARILIPASGIVSALIITGANLLVENIPLFMNIPTGIFVSILSVPYFIYLLIRNERF